MNKLLTAAAICALATGCMTAPQHQQAIDNYEEERLTLAAVQRSVQVGMSGSQVLSALGSPNIVSTDEHRHEIWVYDRVGTEYVHSESDSGLISLITGATGAVAGGVLPSFHHEAGASRRSQRTLTIIVRFDGDKQVKDFSYHASRF